MILKVKQLLIQKIIHNSKIKTDWLDMSNDMEMSIYSHYKILLNLSHLQAFGSTTCQAIAV